MITFTPEAFSNARVLISWIDDNGSQTKLGLWVDQPSSDTFGYTKIVLLTPKRVDSIGSPNSVSIEGVPGVFYYKPPQVGALGFNPLSMTNEVTKIVSASISMDVASFVTIKKVVDAYLNEKIQRALISDEVNRANQTLLLQIKQALFDEVTTMQLKIAALNFEGEKAINDLLIKAKNSTSSVEINTVKSQIDNVQKEYTYNIGILQDQITEKIVSNKLAINISEQELRNIQDQGRTSSVLLNYPSVLLQYEQTIRDQGKNIEAKDIKIGTLEKANEPFTILSNLADKVKLDPKLLLGVTGLIAASIVIIAVVRSK